MGRHGGGRSRRARFSATGTVLALVLLLAGALVLGAWWWRLRESTDPIDASPMGGYAIVVSSAPCTDAAAGNSTVVTIVGLEPVTQTTLPACGYRQGQRLAIEYLAGHPETARLAGTSTGRDAGDLRRWLPIAILAAGVLAVGATIMLLREQRRAHGGRSRANGRVTVAELRAAAAEAAADPPGEAPAGNRSQAPPTPAGPLGSAAVQPPDPQLVSPPPVDLAVDPGSAAPQPGEPWAKDPRPADPQPTNAQSGDSPSATDRTDPGTGDIPVFRDDRRGLLDHAGDQPLLTHGGTEDQGRPVY